MAATDNPEVQRFYCKDVKGLDDVEIILGPHVAMVKTAKWPRDENGEATGIGEAQTIVLHRHSLIGMAYEILASLGKVAP